MYKLKKTIGDRQIAKYYDSEKLALLRQTKDWEISKVPDVSYTAEAINKGKLELPKFKIMLPDDVVFYVATEGTANKLVEELSRIYDTVISYKMVINDIPEEDE